MTSLFTIRKLGLLSSYFLIVAAAGSTPSSWTTTGAKNVGSDNLSYSNGLHCRDEIKSPNSKMTQLGS